MLGRHPTGFEGFCRVVMWEAGSLASSGQESDGLYGHAGAGKSSLVSLLLRLSECTEGDIVIDGLNIREVGLRKLRRAIGFVPQTPFLFDVSHALPPHSLLVYLLCPLSPRCIRTL